MSKFSVFIFLFFAVVTFLLHRFELAAANFLTFVGFAMFEYRFELVVRFRLQHIWEYRFRRIGLTIGYLAATALIVMIALRYLKIYNF
ncbi:MAG TPA: hypothetical protein PLU67_06285 [Candidatus Kapabacteria bacterium]|mgnify:FL=1|nr:hypothetical protein [Candidatus Kapabacteria bacterium]HOM05087.1 hypothetical protein [Candidatus Kapabacteria bacterium]HOQ48288.1 hypothetical protein [Candidatus Kapabacteria bacterium]HPP40349.1 hypothetical protein [Candidatus Kapabacteria bacterium]HPU24028.1 hypothetical protein [Candidatus Kapabacteria bacterium]